MGRGGSSGIDYRKRITNAPTRSRRTIGAVSVSINLAFREAGESVANGQANELMKHADLELLFSSRCLAVPCAFRARSSSFSFEPQDRQSWPDIGNSPTRAALA